MKFAVLWAAALAAILVATALPAAAQPPGAYWNGDVCHQERAAAAHRGTFLGALFGGIFGSAIAGRHDRAAGAVVGGSAGAVIGHAAGASSVQCLPYPPRIEAHGDTCQWVNDAYDGGPHEFEVCRDPDGVWRPSGRS
jgi:uncharacterized protein YcfJ